jgi:hypothetical protein
MQMSFCTGCCRSTVRAQHAAAPGDTPRRYCRNRCRGSRCRRGTRRGRVPRAECPRRPTPRCKTHSAPVAGAAVLHVSNTVAIACALEAAAPRESRRGRWCTTDRHVRSQPGTRRHQRVTRTGIHRRSRSAGVQSRPAGTRAHTCRSGCSAVAQDTGSNTTAASAARRTRSAARTPLRRAVASSALGGHAGGTACLRRTGCCTRSLNRRSCIHGPGVRRCARHTGHRHA